MATKKATADHAGKAVRTTDTVVKQRAPARSAASTKQLPSVPAAQIDMKVDRNHRPLTGEDVLHFVMRHKLERIEVVSALALASPGIYQNIVDVKGSLPMDVELLLRLYMEEPPRPKWRPVDVFRMIYGDLLQKFEYTDGYEPAKIMLYARFTALLGRTIYTSYRWLEQNSDGSYGQTSGPVRRLLANLPSDPTAMRQKLEGLARVTWRARGIDFEAEFPLPDPKNPPLPRSRGPIPRKLLESMAAPGESRVAAKRAAHSDPVLDAVKSAAKGRTKASAQTDNRPAAKKSATPKRATKPS
jgi:hypothetical protein